MAKKSLKRGLALGALMAFVITGSAMAEKVVANSSDTTKIIDSSKYVDDAGSIIYANGASYDGIVSINTDTNLKEINITNNSNFSDAYGVYAYDNQANGVGAKIDLGTENTDTINITANGLTNSWAAGICAWKGGEVNVKAKTLNINVDATNGLISAGIWVQGNSNTDTKVIIDADNTIINATSPTKNIKGIVAFSGSTLEIKGGLEVYADVAITTRGGSTITINESGEKTVKLNGNIDFDYHAATSGTPVDANVKINLTGPDSYWKGTTQVAWSANDDGTGKPSANDLTVDSFSLTIADGAKWQPTYLEVEGEYDTNGNGASQEGIQYPALNNVTLKDGIIDLTNAKDQVKIENASGTGTVLVGAADNAMGITASNNATLTVAATSAYAEEIASNDMIAAANNLAAKVKDETGTEAKTAASNVYIPETTVTGAVNANVGADGRVARLVEAVNATNAAVSDMASVSLMTWRQENNDMNKRLGELRDSKGQHGAWARMARGESEYGAQNVKNQYNYYQVGYDEKLSTDSNWTVGVALTRTEGTSTFTRGSGENNHTGVAIYGSYLGDNGSFIDLIAKYSRMDNEYKTIGGVGNADYETNGYSVSAEYGKRFTKDNGLWIEPQVELTYGKVSSANYMTSNNAMVRQDGIDSFVGRIGFALGKNIKAGNVYARASYLYDFDGDTSVSYSKGGVSRAFEQDLGGGWWEVGIGSNINLSNATHLYFDIEKTYGGDVATPWQWNLGVRYSF